MALEYMRENLDGLPDPVKSEYTERDGKFFLSVNGLGADFAPKSEIAKANKQAADLRGAMQPWKDIGKTPEEIKEALEQLAAGSSGKTKAEFEAMLTQHKATWAAKESDLTKQLETANSRAKNAYIDSAVSSALAKAKATPEGISLLPRILKDRVDFSFDEQGKPLHRILMADGNPMIGSGPGGAATYDDFMADVKKLYPSLFEGSGSGSGSPPRGPGNGGGSGEKAVTRAEFDKLNPLQQALKMKEGFKVIDN